MDVLKIILKRLWFFIPPLWLMAKSLYVLSLGFVVYPLCIKFVQEIPAGYDNMGLFALWPLISLLITVFWAVELGFSGVKKLKGEDNERKAYNL